MKIAIFAYSRQGCLTARRVKNFWEDHDVRCYTMERFAEPDFLPLQKPSRDFYGQLFAWSDVLVFVGSTGIAVREIAPHIQDKTKDPAVLVIDELGKFVIPLLSGHIGGANVLALSLSHALDSVPVITTATDINRRFSVDAWAAQNDFVISNMNTAKAVSAAILEGNVPLCSDYPIVSALPNGVEQGSNGSVGIKISIYREEPFGRTLRLIPRVLHLGIGCRKGTSCAAIREAVEAVLEQHWIDRRAVKCVASIDLKAQEEGLLQFCEEENLSVSFYTAQQLQSVDGEFTPSSFVQSITGVENVCERSALYGADQLIVKKTPRNGVTVAVAAENLEVRFE